MENMLASTACDLGKRLLKDNPDNERVYLVNEPLNENIQRKVTFQPVPAEETGWEDEGYAIDFSVELPANGTTVSSAVDALDRNAEKHGAYDKFTVLADNASYVGENDEAIKLSIEYFFEETQPEAHLSLGDLITQCEPIEQALRATAEELIA